MFAVIGSRLVPVIETIRHPLFEPKSLHTPYDVVLLRLPSTFEEEEMVEVSPICLALTSDNCRLPACDMLSIFTRNYDNTNYDPVVSEYSTSINENCFNDSDEISEINVEFVICRRFLSDNSVTDRFIGLNTQLKCQDASNQTQWAQGSAARLCLVTPWIEATIESY